MVRLLSKPTNIILLVFITFFITLSTNSPAFVKTDAKEFNYVPDALTFLSSDYAIVIDKTMQRLFVFHSNNGNTGLVYQTRCSTGKNRGNKTKTGDAKTPEGIYFPTRQYGDEELSSIYGSMAFHLDYPNLNDVSMGRNGNNIWIHGTNKPLQDFQSNGCITLENSDIETVSSYITLYETPIIIYDYIRWVPREVIETLREELQGVLDLWIDAINGANKTVLSSMYSTRPAADRKSTNFLVSQTGKWKNHNLAFSLQPKAISLLKYDDYAVIIFEQVLSLDTLNGSYGNRKLFLKRHPENWLIIGDQLQKPQTYEQFSQNLLTLDESMKTHVESASRHSIEDMIKGWSKSWESGDMERYRSFYASDFKSAKMNLDSWISYKKRLSKINKDIKIEIRNIKITLGDQKSVAVFEQMYNSSRHNALGIKNLHLKKTGNRWLIHREFWKAIKE